MGTNQYHEPANELSAEIRTFARMITGLKKRLRQLGWYEQRLSLEKDKEAEAIMEWTLSFFCAGRKNGGTYSKLFYSVMVTSSRQPKNGKAGQVAQLEPVSKGNSHPIGYAGISTSRGGEREGPPGLNATKKQDG
jgi:hypothetical protein